MIAKKNGWEFEGSINEIKVFVLAAEQQERIKSKGNGKKVGRPPKKCGRGRPKKEKGKV